MAVAPAATEILRMGEHGGGAVGETGEGGVEQVSDDAPGHGGHDRCTGDEMAGQSEAAEDEPGQRGGQHGCDQHPVEVADADVPDPDGLNP